MSQHDMNIANQLFPATRADFNAAAVALSEKQSGGTAPATTFSFMDWLDTSTNLWKIRNSGNASFLTWAQISSTAIAAYNALNFFWAGSLAGTDTLTLTLDPAPTAYRDGQVILAKAAATNAGAVTLNLNALGAKAVQKSGAALVAGDIVNGKFYAFLYEATGQTFQLQDWNIPVQVQETALFISLKAAATEQAFQALIKAFCYNTIQKTGAYTILVGDIGQLIECDATTASFTLSGPVSPTEGMIFGMKKMDSTVNTVTFDPDGAATVDGVTTFVLSIQYGVAIFVFNGTNWDVLAATDGITLDGGTY